jgi:Fe-S-cluster containining protein
VEADEDQTLKAIPPELLFDAPGSDGVKLMGHDKKGNCPLFQEGCSIYKFRPRTCRNFDCRVYGATGITPEFTSSALLDQIQAWKFTTQTELDHTLQKAVFDAVDFLNLHESTLPDDLKPYSSMRLAFLAVCMHTLFLKNVKEDPASMILRMKEEMKRLRML